MRRGSRTGSLTQGLGTEIVAGHDGNEVRHVAEASYGKEVGRINEVEKGRVGRPLTL